MQPILKLAAEMKSCKLFSDLFYIDLLSLLIDLYYGLRYTKAQDHISLEEGNECNVSLHLK